MPDCTALEPPLARPAFVERRNTDATHNALLCMLSAFDALANGLAVVTAHGNVLYANRVARQTLQDLGWTRNSSPLCLVPPAHATEWNTALHSTCSRQTHHVVDIAGPGSVHEELYAALTPLAVGSQNCALVTLGRSNLCGALELQMFAMLHRLSTAEGQVLRHICHGHRPSAIADLQGTAVSTVLSHLSAIRSKTDCTSVQDLLRKVARLPPIRPLILVS